VAEERLHGRISSKTDWIWLRHDCNMYATLRTSPMLARFDARRQLQVSATRYQLARDDNETEGWIEDIDGETLMGNCI
jgi:hypothetical protein